MDRLIYGIFMFVIGACIGSFLNVVILRRDKEVKFYHGRSKCCSCSHELNSLDLIPILSYIGLKGKCRYCNTKLTPNYIYGEIIGGFIFLVTYLKYGFQLNSVSQYIISISFMLTSISDLHTKEIRYKYLFIPLAVVIVLNYIMKSIQIDYIGFVIMFIVMYITYILFSGKLGGADVVLIAILAGIYGLNKVNYILLLACLLAVIQIGVNYILNGKEALKTPIPFIPVLILSSYILELIM